MTFKDGAMRSHPKKKGSALTGSELIPQLIDEFEHTGPNGVHCCIISGPLSSDIEDLYPDEYPTDIAKRITSQVSRGVEYLRSRDVVPYWGTPIFVESFDSRNSRDIF